MSRYSKGFSIVALLLCFGQAHSQEIMGAKEVLRRIANPNERAGSTSMTVFEFADSLRTLKPKLAGEKWANACLHDQNLLNPVIRGESFNENEFAALPGPETWPFIDAWFKSKKAPTACQLLGSYLVGDRARQRKLILQIASENKNTIEIWPTMLSFGLAWRDQELVSKAIHGLVDLHNRASVELKPRQYSDLDQKIGTRLVLPDLARPMGDAFATTMIQYALKHTKRMVMVQGVRGQEIAVALCKKEGATYPIARYELVQRTSAGDLYPLLNKWFPQDTSNAKARAKAFNTQFRLLQGQTNIDWADLKLIEETRYANEEYEPVVTIDDDFEEQLQKPEIASRVRPQLEKKVLVDATREEVESYQVIMTTLGQQAEMKPVLEQILTQKSKGQNDHTRYEAARILRSLASIQGNSDDLANLSFKHLSLGVGSDDESYLLGTLLHRSDLVEKAVEIQKTGNQSDYLLSLFGLKRYAELEKNALASEHEGAMTLLHMYSDLGREQDVLDLLDQFPDWRDADLKDLSDYQDWKHHRNLFYEVAKALLKTDKKPLGTRVLRRSLTTEGAVEAAYDLFVQTVGKSEALKELERMYQADPYDPYPLVWRAKIFLSQKKFDEAEVSIRKAFLINPFDTSYLKCKAGTPQKVLRDILKAQGRKAEADKVDSLLEAIAIGEKAEELVSAGLIFDGVDLYKKAIALYPDQCSNQLGLGKALSSLEKHDEAERYYRNAFRLLPERIGQATDDSNRWDLFENSREAKIAEDVFRERLKVEPNNPHLTFLLGSLCENQKRYSESISYLEKTSELDPQYLNAWCKLADWLLMPLLTSELSERCVTSVVRLDPTGRYGYLSEDKSVVLNPLGYYNAVRSANRFHFMKEQLYPLAAATVEIERGGHGYSIRNYSPADTLPGQALFQTVLAKSLQKLVVEQAKENK